MKKITTDKIICIIAVFILIILSILSLKKSAFIMIDKAKNLNQENVKANLEEIKEEHRNNFMAKNSFINIYGITEKILNKKIIGNFEFIKDKNNVIHTFGQKSNDVETFNDSMLELKKITDKKNIPLIYIQVPTKTFKNNISGLNFKVENDINDDMDLVIDNLNKNNIKFMDIREILEKEKYPKENVFFKTDAHMTTEAELWFTDYLINYLEENYQIKPENKDTVMNSENYMKTSEKLIGNYIRSVGKYYDGTDDFNMYIPKFDTSFTVTDFNNGEVKQGSFKEAIMNGYENVEGNKEMQYWITNYLRYPSPYYNIENHKVNKGRILFIMDSNTITTASYMALMYNNITILDPRWQESNDYVRKALNENTYDIVLVAQSNQLMGSNFFIDAKENLTAEIVSNNAPTEINKYDSYNIDITVKNTSNEIWSEKDKIRLCIWQNGQDFGYRINIPDGVEIKPNEEYTFTLKDFVAPPNDSTYLEFQMLQEGITYFGEKERVDIAVK